MTALEALEVVLGVFFIPYDLISQHNQNRRREIDEGLRPSEQQVPRGINRKGPRRALSQIEACAQASSLLSRLPIELRQHIWNLLLGDMKFHLLVRGHRFGHQKCHSPDYAKCVGFTKSERCPAYPTPLELLAVLLTCRQMYVEGIQILYSANDFITISRTCIENLPRMFTPQNLNLIRSLRLAWRIGSPPLPPEARESKTKRKGKLYKRGTWTDTWRTIAGMKSLHNLEVTLRIDSAYWGVLSAANTELVLDPIRSVTIPDDFILFLPFSTTFSGAAWQALPCRIVIQHQFTHWR